MAAAGSPRTGCRSLSAPPYTLAAKRDKDGDNGRGEKGKNGEGEGS